jgi:transcription elongation factor GreA
MNKVIISREGLKKFEKELGELKTKKRKEMAGKIKKALEQGDLSENAEYAEAKEEQAFVEGRIVELEMKIKNAEVIKNHKSQTIRPGSKIKVKLNGSKMDFEVVGASEANPSLGRISNESPIGAALINHKVKDKVEVETPGGKIQYEILKIE